MNYPLNLVAGWTGFIGGAVSGALIGLFFHKENWLGGYSSFPRRLVRLGHIAFFSLHRRQTVFRRQLDLRNAGHAT
jgi:hypothetical protein